jgi:uridine kinase
MERRELIDDVASRIGTIARPHPVRVAIDGVDAAGKTAFADELAEVLTGRGRRIVRASIDGFHNPAAIRRRRGAMSPEGYFYDSFDYAALLEGLLEPLGPGGSLAFRRAVFDFRTDSGVDAPLERTEPHAILLLDGVFLLRPQLRKHFDFSVFLHADFNITLARAEERDADLFGNAEEVRRRYRERYIPGQRIYLTTVQPERWASLVIDNNDPAHPFMQRALD